jgi:mono/diheme cytochrome c family protein
MGLAAGLCAGGRVPVTVTGRRAREAAAAVALVLAAVTCTLAGDARGTSPAREEQAARIAAGQRLFHSYCAACHGERALGDGPVAPSLRMRPADLTRIAQRRGGNFDAAETAAYIDGRIEVSAHGEREMPVWGRIYDDRNERILDDETLLSPGMIFDVVEYLRSIQQR